MNVRMYDNTVRCAEHFDATSYQSETSDPCLYCQETQTDQEWLDALSALIVDQPRRTLRLGKTRPCDRCVQAATWKISHGASPDEFLCTDHGREWFPELFPIANSH